MYKLKPNVLDAILFDELVEYGKEHGANIVNGMPWSFEYNGIGVTHENDKCYFINTLDEVFRFTPSDVLVRYKTGYVFVCTINWFILNCLEKTESMIYE